MKRAVPSGSFLPIPTRVRTNLFEGSAKHFREDSRNSLIVNGIRWRLSTAIVKSHVATCLPQLRHFKLSFVLEDFVEVMFCSLNFPIGGRRLHLPWQFGA
jgi:hypothetical protein